MAVFGSAGGQQSVILTGVTNPQIDNVVLTLANTEYSVTLPANTQKYFVKLRDSTVELKLRYISGSDYVTIPRGCNFSEDTISAPTLTLYFEAGVAAQTLEIVTWS